MATSKINTYHCLCTSMLLATTHTLSSLPRRSSPDASSPSDSAIILPIPPLPASSTSSPSPPPETDDEPSGLVQEVKPLPVSGYTTILSLTTDRNTTIIRRSNGFESRKLLRCGRCRLVVGYELDRGVSTVAVAGKENDMKVVYLLPGGLMSTDAMASGKKITEEEVGVMRGIAAWE